MKDTGNQRLVRNTLFICPGLDIHEIGGRETNIYTSAFNKGGASGVAKRSELCLCRTHGNQDTFFVGAE